MECPKCGFEQPESPECMACGIIVAKFRPRSADPAPAAGLHLSAPPPPPPPPPGASANPAETLVWTPPPESPAGQAAGEIFGPPHGPPPAAEPNHGLHASGLPQMYEPPPPGTPGPTSSGAASPARTGRGIQVGEVVSSTFQIFLSNLIPFAIITLIVNIPVLVINSYMSQSMDELNSSVEELGDPAAWEGMDGDEALQAMEASGMMTAGLNLLALAGLSVLATILVTPVATAAITYGVFRHLRGRPAGIDDSLKVGLALILPLLGLAIVQGFLVGLGFLFCLIPGIYLMVRFAVAVPAAVEERPGVFGALGRSGYLTEGYRWAVFGVLFLFGAINYGAERILSFFFLGPSGVGFSQSYILASTVNDMLFTGLTATASAVMYYGLRSHSEGTDMSHLTSVFD